MHTIAIGLSGQAVIHFGFYTGLSRERSVKLILTSEELDTQVEFPSKALGVLCCEKIPGAGTTSSLGGNGVNCCKQLGLRNTLLES